MSILPLYRKLAYDLGVKTKEYDAVRYNQSVCPANSRDGVYQIDDRNGNSDRVHTDRLTLYTLAWGAVPKVHTGSAKSTLVRSTQTRQKI
ncbi:hypothetical protein BB561_001908 [Smittium simulii]|uniref:Uncharacterized protein n=1 Tax=Smittium simulii TaxID=133385 RepID=A0A2T9YSM6_9FUNG|nr:hypothetical protein BB561_001908 [Smittium simulii]